MLLLLLLLLLFSTPLPLSFLLISLLISLILVLLFSSPFAAPPPGSHGACHGNRNSPAAGKHVYEEAAEREREEGECQMKILS
jgi:hypothetical protein